MGCLPPYPIRAVLYLLPLCAAGAIHPFPRSCLVSETVFYRLTDFPSVGDGPTDRKVPVTGLICRCLGVPYQHLTFGKEGWSHTVDSALVGLDAVY